MKLPKNPYSEWRQRRKRREGRRYVERLNRVSETLGLPHGNLVGWSKGAYVREHPDNKVYFNAVIFDCKGKKLWTGDLDLTVSQNELRALAAEVGQLYVTPEINNLRGRPYAWDDLNLRRRHDDLVSLDTFLSRRQAKRIVVVDEE